MRNAIATACCAALVLASTPAMADTRASSLLPLSQKAAATQCLAGQANAAVETAAQAPVTQGCILPLRAAPPPASPAAAPAPAPATPVPPAPPAAAAPVAAGGTGWLLPALLGLAALVGVIAVAGGSDSGDGTPGLSPG